MREKTFAKHLYESFLSIYGPFIAVFGIFLTLITYYLVPKDTLIQFNNVIIFFFIIFFFLLILLQAAITAFFNKEISLPPVRRVIQPYGIFSGAVAILVLEPSILFSHDSMVSIFKNDGQVELLVGIGKVANIQQNKFIQVLVIKDLGFESEWEKIMNNDYEKLKLLIVKPSVPSIVLEGV